MDEYCLFVEHSCPLCAEAQCALDANNIRYKLIHITSGIYPNTIFVWDKNPPTLIDKSTIPFVPALFDKKKNILLCGLDGILKILEIDF